MLSGKKEPVRRGKRERRGIKNINVSTYRSSQKLLPWEAALNAQLSAQQLNLLGYRRGRGFSREEQLQPRARVTAWQGRDIRRGLCE